MKRVTLLISVVLLAGLSCGKTQEPPRPSEFESADPTEEMKGSSRVTEFSFDNLEWLAQNSTLVFVGSIVNQEVKRDERDLIITRNHFQLKKVLAGEYGEKALVLTTLGGTLTDRTLRVAQMPQFVEGFDYIVFTDPARTTYDPVTGNQNGVFILNPADNGVYNYNGIGIVGAEDGRLLLGREYLDMKTGVTSAAHAEIDEDPEAKGEIVSIERDTRTAKMNVMTLEDFQALVLEYSRR